MSKSSFQTRQSPINATRNLAYAERNVAKSAGRAGPGIEPIPDFEWTGCKTRRKEFIDRRAVTNPTRKQACYITCAAAGQSGDRSPASCTALGSARRASPPMMVIPSGRRNSVPGPVAMTRWDAGEQRSHRRHQDRPEPGGAGLEDCVRRRQAAVALCIERKVHHLDAVFLGRCRSAE